jgi:NAD(P)-dependent dehydrogenase (short-subunit alcohol dehydrogenase family)
VAAVVHAEVDEALCAPVALVDTTPEEWQERCAGPVASALRTARAAYDVLAGAGGTVGFVCPSVGLTGAAGHVALASASESVRLLAKSAARRWGRHGITVNAFAPPLAACLPGSPLDARTAEVNATAFPDVDPADEIAALVAALASPGAPRLTGATLGTDGGELMLP